MIQARAADESFATYTGQPDSEQPDQEVVVGDPAVTADPSLPTSMGTLGDSITAGAVANYQRRDAQNPLNLGFILTQVLTAGLTKNARPLEARSYSWATGLNLFKPVNSHAHRIVKLLNGAQFRTRNAAVSGAVAKDVVVDQLPKLMDWSQSKLGQAAPDYVTVFIGANDICKDTYDQMTSTSDYINTVATAVDTMLAKSPRTKVLVMTLPKIDTLQSVAGSALHVGIAPVKTCQDFWKLANVCGSLNLEADPLKRQIAVDRVHEYNEALRDMVSSRQADFGDRVRLANGPAEVNFDKDDVSMDCFHPSTKGQNKLAQKSWEITWWK